MSVLTPEQSKYIAEQAERIKAEPGFQKEIDRRIGIAEQFRIFIEESGVLTGGTMTAEQLAKLVELEAEIQNLNPIVLPQLVGSYTYYRHFKGFPGSPEEFAAHMAARNPNWEPGSTGYPGTDLAKWSRDLRRLLTCPEGELGTAVRSVYEHPGAGRAFVTGLLILWKHEKFGLVNNASVGRFRTKGEITYIHPKARIELRNTAIEVYGIPGTKEFHEIRRAMGWMELMSEIRNVGEFSSMLGVDWMMWRLSIEAKGEAAGRLPSGASVAKGGGSRNVARPEDLAEATAARVPVERIEVRRKAADQARSYIESHLGNMTEDDLREVLRLFNVDFDGGKERADRFTPAFVGATAHKLVESLPAVNEWIERVWKAEGDTVFGLLTQAWESKAIPSAKSVLSMVLHVKEPETYPPVMGVLSRGYRAITGDWPAHTGQTYKGYCEGVAALREGHGISPYAVDVFLWEAARAAKKAKPKKKGLAGKDAKAFTGFGMGAFTFLQELVTNNNDEWFRGRRQVFRSEIREPMRDLVRALGERFVEPVCPELERKPNSPETLASPRKNAFGQTVDIYWPHYWAAFHRAELKKTEDFQLYIFIRGDVLRYGMSTGAAKDPDRAQFVRRLRDHGDLAQRAIDVARAADLVVLLDGDESVTELESAGKLADLVENHALVICRRLTPQEATAMGEDIVEDADRVFRAAYPLFALATAEDPQVALREYWTGDDEAAAGEEDEAFSLDELRHETLMTAADIEEIEDLLDDKKQLVLYGPPGTGKTWLAERLAKYICGAGGATRLVQFHPSYGYEDFIEGIRPSIDPDTRSPIYRVEPGVFRRFCDEARRKPQHKFVLIIDEINRGNLPRIFGELLYLLERRGERVELPVSGKQFSVPENVLIVGTMNTADHSIALVDVALRRRFHFKSLEPDAGLLKAWLKREVPDMAGAAELLEKLNEELGKENVDANLRIGHSHFMQPGLDETMLRRIWRHSIMPTLEEYFYGKPKKLARFEFERFVDADMFESEESVATDPGVDEEDDESAEP